jgi:DNA-binding response OmpR family regulator
VRAKRKILIIEDETDVADMLKRQLDRAGDYTSLIAVDGASGIKFARDQLPSLVVLDLMLPGLSGLEVCRMLRSDSATRHIPIAMLTAKAEEVDRIVGRSGQQRDHEIVAVSITPRRGVRALCAAKPPR